MAGLMLTERRKDDVYFSMYSMIIAITFVFRHGVKQGNTDALRWLYSELSVSFSNLLSRENERISCENLEKYGGLFP